MSEPHRFALLRRLGVIALVVVVPGLPINQLGPYALLVLAVVAVWCGTVSDRLRSWAAAIVIAMLCVAGQIWVSPPPIEEGHNIFLPDAPDGALARGLPTDVYRFMAAQFDVQYPPGERCKPNPAACPVNGGPLSTYAFSGDGLLDTPRYSRRATGINFSQPTWARLGFLNDNRYNWMRGSSALERAWRDRRFWMGLHRWHVTMPWFVMYQIPRAYAGGSLCWRGDVLWEGSERFQPIHHDAMACRTISEADANKRIYGVAIKPESLAMRLDPPFSVAVRHGTAQALMLLGFLAILGLLVRVRFQAIVVPLILIGGSLLVIAVIDVSFIGGWRPFDGGDDGLFYESVGRHIAQALRVGDIWTALRGGEDIFYYGGPGLRYLRALELFVFGDTNLGYLSVVLTLPFIALGLFERFLPRAWALTLTLLFVFVPAGALFGTSFLHYAGWASRGFADPAAYIAALTGLLVLLSRPQSHFAAALGGSFLLTLGVLIKPVIAPFVGVILGGAGLAALVQWQWSRVLGLCLGFLPITTMALHNWVYGGKLVLTSTNANLPELLVMPPSSWLAAGNELVHLDWTGPHVKAALAQLAHWLSGPAELYAMIPLHALAVAVLGYILIKGRSYDPWLRLIAGATLAQHAVALFYVANPRYTYMTWFATLLVTAVWFEQAVVPWFRRRWPALATSIAEHPTSRRLARLLKRVNHPVHG